MSVVDGPLALGPLTDAEDIRAPSRALVIGDPESGSGSFPPLPGAREEARAVAARWGLEPLLGSQATLAEVTRRAPESDLIYIAAHGYVFPAGVYGRGRGDFIALAGEDRWTASAIQMARLRARLVVLSGCDTTLGLSRESGVAGMARDFHWSGVPRVVSSLWSVDDAATLRLMGSFVGDLEGAEPAEALRRAMDGARREGVAPWRWAAFAASGSPGPALSSLPVRGRRWPPRAVAAHAQSS